jgi:hypothetical protein
MAAESIKYSEYTKTAGFSILNVSLSKVTRILSSSKTAALAK